MSIPETESELEPEERAAAAEPVRADPGGPGRHNRILIPVATVALLGLVGWATVASIGHSNDTSSAERAESTRITVWATGSESRIAALHAGSRALAADIGKPDLAAVGGDANRLKAAVATADTRPQAPDTDANADWETALAEYSSAVQSAEAGAGGADPQALANAASLLGAGDAELAALDQLTQTLGG